MKTWFRTICLFLAASVHWLSVGAEPLRVSAAASLADALKQIGTEFEKSNGVRIVLNLGASSLLARQIEEGAPADVFFSADEARMDALEKKGLIRKDSRRTLLTNSLVIVVPLEDGLPLKSAQDLNQPGVRRIALAETKSVPAGVYARQYLEGLGLWKSLEARVVPTENVRAALAAVESGNVDAGIVYKTDAPISKKVKVAFEVPVQDGPRIQYPAAVIANTSQPALAQQFLEYLSSPPARRVFLKFGFITGAANP